MDDLIANQGQSIVAPSSDARSGTTLVGGFAIGRTAAFLPASATFPSGGALSFIAPAQQTIAGSGTINHNNCGIVNVTAAGAVTGVILQAGTTNNQTLDIINTQAGANTITFAAAGTSNVADGATTVMAGLRMYRFAWDVTSARWYRAG